MLKPYLMFPVLLAGALIAQQPAAAPAAIPADAAQMVNPVKPNAESQAKAKKMYGYDCAMCHGEKGDGKGDLVADLKLTLKDYTDPATLKGLSDGEMFYIIKNGKGQMSGEGDRAKPDDIWNLVIYVRSLATKNSMQPSKVRQYLTPSRSWLSEPRKRCQLHGTRRQLQLRCRVGSTLRISQPLMPFRGCMGGARRVRRWPLLGRKSMLNRRAGLR